MTHRFALWDAMTLGAISLDRHEGSMKAALSSLNDRPGENQEQTGGRTISGIRTGDCECVAPKSGCEVKNVSFRPRQVAAERAWRLIIALAEAARPGVRWPRLTPWPSTR